MRNISTNKYLKIANSTKVYSLIRERKELSKSQLSLQSGLSFSAVSKICNSLVDEGMLMASETLESTGGRKAACIELVPDYAYTLAIDLHHTRHGYVGLVDIAGRISRSERFPVFPDDTLEAILNRISLAASHIMPDPEPRFLGVCAGVSAVISKDSSLAQRSSNPVYDGVNLRRHIENLFPGTTVIVDNDANLAGLSEMTLHPSDNRLFIFFTQGLGLGITINSELYRGTNGFAGEFGHMKVTGNDRLCKCGNHGCLRTVATLESIASDLGEESRLEGAATSTAYSDDLAKRYSAGEEAVVKRVDYAAEKIGEAIATLSDLFNPREIVLGGNLGKLFPLIRQQIWASCRVYSKLARSVDASIRTIEEPTHELIMRGAGERMFGYWLEHSFMEGQDN